MIKLAVLFRKEGKGLRCLACAHKCLIQEGKIGICGVRKNVNGKLYLLVYGKLASVAVDPIEKKPLYHFLSGSKSLSIGTVGCNFKCKWCQNYEISQASKNGNFFGNEKTPKEIVELAIKHNCKSISYTYNEPIIFLEFVRDTAELARKRGIKNILVTNGYFSKESFEYIASFIDAMNIDLKSINPEVYEKYCGAKLNPILKNIKKAYEKGIHIELTTLVIPEVNDSEEEFKNIAKFISSINNLLPWHILRFFPKYKMKDKPFTSKQTLEKAYEIGKREGLKYVHLGNI